MRGPGCRTWKNPVRLFAIIVWSVITVGAGLAQDAGLVGIVTDPSGAVITGAQVMIKNVQTGVERRAATDDRGRYSVSPLAIGQYTLTVGMAGFRTHVVSNIYLTIGQIGHVDVTLQLGEVSEKVNVVDTAPLLQAEQASLGQSVENKKIVDLPLNGRDFVQLVALTPGATTAGGAGETGNPLVLVNGHRSTKTTSTLDGTLNIDQLFQGFPISPSIDVIEEFKVESGNFSADQGMGPSNVSVRIKSGTNEIHGSVFEFLRNDKLDARNFFQPERSILKRNQFGGAIGGPLKKDKVFWFIGYEGTRQREGLAYNITVPTEAQRSGNFTGLTPIIDPVTGQPFPNNTIPADRINQVANYFIPFFPLPNAGTQFIHSPSQSFRRDQVNGRYDHYLNDANRVYVSYTFNQNRLLTPDAMPKQGGALRQGRAQSAAVNWNRTFSPRVMNTLTLGWSRFRNVLTSESVGTNHTVLSGLQGFDETTAKFPGFPSLSIGGYQGINGFDWTPLINPTENRQIKDDFSIIRGEHQIRVGTDLRRFIWSSKSAAVSRGFIDYSGDYSADGWADFLLGLPLGAFRQFPQDNYNQQSFNLAWYVHDDWRITPRLTLNLGLRYEYDTWPVDSRNQITSFDPVSGKFVVGHEGGKQPDLAAQTLAPLAWSLFGDLMARAEDVGLPNRSLRFPDKNNWAPRFGLAYRPTFLKDTVVRLGYGVFYSLLNGNNYSDATATSIPWIISQGVNNTTPFPTLDNQNLFVPFDTPGAASPNIQPIIFDPRARVPYLQAWNLAVQRQLNSSTSIEVAYVGNKGTHLETRVPFNRAATPGPGPIEARRQFQELSEGYAQQNISNSNYNAMQIKLERRYAGGLAVLASYTLAKSIDTASSDFGSGVQNMNDLRAERAVSNFDHPQRLSVGYVYELPFGSGRRMLSSARGAAQQLLGGWELAGIVTLQSGAPFTITSGRDRANIGTSSSQRPNRMLAGKLDRPTLNRWFDTTAFVLNDQFTFGNSGRNILRGDGLAQWDFSLLKNFAVREGMILQFRTEFFNVLNHPDFNNPNSRLTSSIFGRVTGTRTAPRIGQFALKLIF
ncbi:MAG: carboxypeptidase regulatory-like domain-containing protein [Acidobacteriota bacterium]